MRLPELPVLGAEISQRIEELIRAYEPAHPFHREPGLAAIQQGLLPVSFMMGGVP